MVQLKEYNNIKEYLVANPDGSYENWIAQWNPRAGKREKVVIQGLYTQEFKEFYEAWPKVRTVKELGQKGICNKDFRGKEEEMYKKYLKAIGTGKITAQELNYAGRSYIANAIEDSIRKGSNELEYRNGMPPWFNQEKYLTWKDIKMPANNRSVQMETEI